MAKCKTCGRRGLFLKLEKSMCADCLNRLFPSGSEPFGLTKDMFLNPEKYIVEEEPIKRNTESEVRGMMTAEDGSKIPVEMLNGFYDCDGLKIIDHNYYELTSTQNIDRAKNDIECLNEHIDKAKRLCKSIPDFRFKKELLLFKFEPFAYTRNYCMMSFSPLTKAGKLCSAPMTLHIVQGEHLRGKIMYDKIGNITRAEVSINVVTRIEKPTLIEQKCDVHKLVFTKQSDELNPRFIYRTKDNDRKKIYDSKAV